jgi:actin-related protein 10
LISAIQVFSSRPLFSHLCTTPLAGARLTTYLRALLQQHGTYIPPQASLAGPAVSVPALQRATHVPAHVLTDALVETIKTRACFVGDPLPPEEDQDQDVTMMVIAPSSSASVSDAGQYDTPPASEAQFPTTTPTTSSATGSVSGSVSGAGTNRRGEPETHPMAAHSRATDLQIAVGSGAGRGVVIIPGWVRERAAEVLFAEGDVDERSVAETVLDSLRKVR